MFRLKLCSIGVRMTLVAQALCSALTPAHSQKMSFRNTCQTYRKELAEVSEGIKPQGWHECAPSVLETEPLASK